MKLVYIVTASAGEYDEYRTWNVKAFTTEKKASKFQKLAQEVSDRFDQIRNNSYYGEEYAELPNTVSDYDSQCELLWNNHVRYSVKKMELK